jgi:predicted DNA-binding ribbon-helix-helix protein
MLDQRLVILLEAAEHTQLKELAANRGVSAASLVRNAIRQILDADVRRALLCRESSPSYGSDLDDDLLSRLHDLAEQQDCSVADYLSGLLDEQETRRARVEALEGLRLLWDSVAREAAIAREATGTTSENKRTWTREELYDR